MASIALIDEPEVAEAEAAEGLTLTDILTPNINLADFLDESERNKIGQTVIRDVDIDERSRGDWNDRYDRWLDIAMQVRTPKNSPWVGASNIKYPTLTTASIRFQAEAYPVIVDGSNLVKGRVLGPDPDGKKRQRADRIAQHTTWQLLYRMPGWEEDTDKLLLMLPITGTVIRKTYYDSAENANCSEMIPACDFIINYMAKGLETAPRYTHVLRYYPYEVQEKVAAGLWREITVDADDSDNDDDALVEFYEQHRTIDLDDDGYPEHYVVTTNKEGEVARIVPCFGPEDVMISSPVLEAPMKLSKLMEMGATLDMIPEVKIIRIKRRSYFTKYGFIPSPDGAFYDVGFGALIDDISQATDTAANQLIDAASLANAQGGFIGDGIQIRGGDKPFRLGEWKRVNGGGQDLRAQIVPLQLPGPSPVLFNLLQMLIQAAKDITSVNDVMTGEGTANQPATTTLALIEQGQKVLRGIFKRIHRAFGNELRILRRLNRDYLDEEEYFNLNDPEPEVGEDGQPVMNGEEPALTTVAKVGREDYADEDLDVIPVSDPGRISDMQKMARSEAEWQSFNGDPLVNQVELRKRRMEALGIPDPKKMLEVPPPAPDPKVVESAAKMELEHKKLEARKPVDAATAAEKFMNAAKSGAELGLLTDAATLAGHAIEESQEEEEGEPHGAPANGPGGIQPMGGQPVDPGMVQLPEGPSAIPDGAMGEGAYGGAGAASAGGPLGPASSDAM